MPKIIKRIQFNPKRPTISRIKSRRRVTVASGKWNFPIVSKIKEIIPYPSKKSGELKWNKVVELKSGSDPGISSDAIIITKDTPSFILDIIETHSSDRYHIRKEEGDYSKDEHVVGVPGDQYKWNQEDGQWLYEKYNFSPDTPLVKYILVEIGDPRPWKL